jgi:glycosyltransferase involved in cell wall biosynthesis
MRLLWVKAGGVWPLHTGGRLRSFHILQELSRRHEVELLTSHTPGEDAEELRRRLPHCRRIASFPFAAPKQGSPAFAAALLRSWLSPFPLDLWRWRVPALRRAVASRLAAGALDLCVADFLTGAVNLPATTSVPSVLFEHNVEHVIWRRLAGVHRGWRRWLLEVEWRKMRRFEALACRRARLTLAVSPQDAAALERLSRGPVRTIPTGVDASYYRPNGAGSPAELVFTGSMEWYPNEDAVLHFLAAILPRIRAEVPEVTLTVVGRKPSRALREAAGPGVHVTGTVDDVRPFLARAALCVVPLRVGGGTRLKIFEALAMGKAVVSTGVGAEGLPLTPGEHFVEADAPYDLARAAVSLLRDPARRRALGNAGRRLVEERYAWPRVAREFEERCLEVVHGAG